MSRRGIVTVLLFSVCCFAACRRDTPPFSQTHAPVSIIDDVGMAVSLQRPAHRIVSMAPSITETLFALGLDSAVVGVTDYCDYPPQVRSKQRIGGIANPSIEQITALQPDLIVMSVAGNMRGDYEKLRALGFPIVVTNPTTVKEVFKSIEDLGILTGRQERARALTSQFRAHYDSLLAFALQFQQKSVLLLISLHPLVAVAPGTFMGDLITLSNGKNVVGAGPVHYPLLNREEILRRQPDVIVVTSDRTRTTEDVMRAYPEWVNLDAVKEGRIRIVDANLIARPGPRILEGWRQMIESIHGRGQ
jgi:iron complex transport system substrate-binding protein